MTAPAKNKSAARPGKSRPKLTPKLESKPKPKPKPLPKKFHKSQERVEESTDDEDEEEEATTTATATTTGDSGSSETSSETSSGSASGSGSDTEIDDQNPATKVPASTYVYAPPPTFKLLPPCPSTSTSNPFSAHNLAGKELWFITAPLAAPLSKLGVINPDDIAAGAPALQTGSGRRYCIRPHDAAEEAAGVELAVHDGRGGYHITRKRIAKSFQVVEVLPVPDAVEADRGARPVRAQPDGLWMRFKPIGYVGAQNEDANVGAVGAEVEVRVDVRDRARDRAREREQEQERGSEQKKKKRRVDGQRRHGHGHAKDVAT